MRGSTGGARARPGDFTDDGPAMSQSTELRTKLGRTWKIKTFLFALALLALGVWGAYDALVVYPKRGRIHSEFMLQNYLERADAELKLGSASVEDPAGTLRSLDEEGARSALEELRYQWLRSLSRVENLPAISRRNEALLAARGPGDPLPESPTLFPQPGQTLRALQQINATRNTPSPLNAYDIPLQYAFMIGGFAGFAWMVVFFVRVKRKSFRYDPGAKRLTLPGGRAFTPEDIEVVDKRKWDKFLVFITLKDGSPEMRLDLYRYHPLEEWILEMEKLSPGYEPVVEEGEPILCVNVIDGRPVRLVPDAGTRLPAPDESGREAVYPVVKTIAGEWLVVGASQRARLREAVEKGVLDRASIKADPRTFEVRVGEHDAEEIPERDLRPSEPEEEEAPATTA